VILVTQGLAIISFFAGYAPMEEIAANWHTDYRDGQNFWTVFAIFFSAVTGITAGVGVLEPNTVMIGWSEDVLKKAEFTSAIRRILRLKRNLLSMPRRSCPTRNSSRASTGGAEPRPTAASCSTLAHLRRSSTKWRGHPILIKCVISDEDHREETAEAVAKFAR